MLKSLLFTAPLCVVPLLLLSLSCSSNPKPAISTDHDPLPLDVDAGSDAGSNVGAAAYGVGGTVTGLSGTGLVLQVNDDELAIGSNGSFQFTRTIASGQAFSVTVKTQPTGPSQSCTVSNGSGAMGNADVSDVTISCSTNTYAIGGTVTGLTGKGLVLQDNARDDLTLSADGEFVFATPVSSGEHFVVTIKTQPTAPDQRCTISNGSGTVDAARISDVSITCATQATGHKIGGRVVGTPLAGLELANNGADKVSISGAGTFSFAAPVTTGASYSVTVATQPPLPGHCTVQANGSGTVGDADVSDVTVNCGLDYTFETAMQAWGISPGGVSGTTLDWSAEGQDATGGALRVTIPYTSTDNSDTRIRAALPADVSWDATGMTVTEWVRIDAAPTTDWAGNIFVYVTDANGQWNTFCFSMMNFTHGAWRKLSGTLPASGSYDWTKIGSIGIVVQANGTAASIYQTAQISVDSVVVE
jgi:hypothetical protein